MKRAIVGIWTLIFILAFTAGAWASLSLKKVILYPSSATLVWRGTVVPGDRGRVDLGYLPSSAIKDSVKVQLISPLELVELRIHEVKEDLQLDRMKGEIDKLKIQLEILKTQKAFIEGLLNTQKTGKGRGWWEKLPLKETLARLHTLSNQLGSLSMKKEALQKELEKKEKNLDKWRQAHRWKMEALVKGQGRASVRLTYRVDQAYWRPIYAARLVDERVTLQFMARVHQETGMDWQGAKVVLSTAQPRGRVEPPQPTPLYLRPVQPVRILEAMPLAKSMAKGKREMPGEKGSYTLLEGVALYTPTNPLYLQSGKDGILKVKEWVLTPKLERFCYAVADPTVYVVAILDQLPQILPPGKMQLYQGPSLVGETYLTFRTPLKLSFGRDQTLKVKRVQTKRYLDKKFGGKVEITVAYQTTIANLGPKTRKVKVVERIPVSQDERVEVKFKGAQPPVKPNKKRGFLKWTVTVPSHGKVQVGYSFSVKYPEKLHLNYPF